MTIYKKRTPSHIYRKIYEQHYGPIPREENGRSYEIHHIDGNTENNDPTNLVALSIQEHYDIHFDQGDYIACRIIAGKLGKPAEEISKLCSLANYKRVENGTHPWVGGDQQRKQQNKLFEDGVHLFQLNNPGPTVTKRRIDDGSHNWVGENHPNFDSTEYTFEHKSGEVIRCTRDYLIKTYTLNRRNVSSMIKGRRPSVGGWRLKI
jgi:hypothetical protein